MPVLSAHGLLGNAPDNVLLHLVVLAGYGIAGYFAAVVLARRLLLQ